MTNQRYYMILYNIFGSTKYDPAFPSINVFIDVQFQDIVQDIDF